MRAKDNLLVLSRGLDLSASHLRRRSRHSRLGRLRMEKWRGGRALCLLVLGAGLPHLLGRRMVVDGLELGLGGRGSHLARVTAGRRLILPVKLLLAYQPDCGLVLGNIARHF